jgi:integrase
MCIAARFVAVGVSNIKTILIHLRHNVGKLLVFMATFKALVYADNKRKDGTYNVKIRVTHARQSLKVSTTLYVDASQLTRSLKFKDARILDQTEEIVRRWRGYANELGVRAEAMTAKQVVEYIKEREREGAGWRLDFVEFCLAQLPQWHGNTAVAYRTAIASFARFVGGAVDVSAITPNLLQSYAEDTRKKAPKSVQAYYGKLQRLYKMAMHEYNNPYTGVVRIPLNPFDYYRPDAPPVELVKRALDVPTLQAIITAPETTWRGVLARDLFALSLGTCGANYADIEEWKASDLKGDILTYRRKKTRTRRADKAEIQIRIEPPIMAIIDRHRAKYGDKLLELRGACLARVFRDNLPRIGKRAGVDHLTFYAARHSWATIARNDLALDKDTVAEALNHTDPSRVVTDRYIKRDFSRVWEANKRVVDLFSWTYNESE